MKEFAYLILGLAIGALLGRAYWPMTPNSGIDATAGATPPKACVCEVCPNKGAVIPAASPVSESSLPGATLPGSSPSASAVTSASPSSGSSPPPEVTPFATPILAATPVGTLAATLAATPAATLATSPTPDPLADQKLDVYFTTELVTALEKQWTQLPKQVRLKKESKGWRVVRVTPGSTFAKTGLLKGDLITTDSVDSLKRLHPGSEQLPTRVSKILNHVSGR